MSDSAYEQIKQYVDNGWKLVPIPRGSKAPKGKHAKGWQTNFITDPMAIGDGNCGILLGEPSGWLIDIDFDWREAAELASYFLPPTDAVFGRTTNKSSHYLYICSGAKTKKFQIGKKQDGGMILELRSTGHQTVFPPSEHKTGEIITWENQGKPAEISITELESGCRQLAAAALIARNWSDGNRQDLSLAIAGLMIKGGIEVDKVKHLIQSVCEYTGDPETEDRLRCITVTEEKVADDIPVAGYQKLVDILGEQTASHISKFLKASVKQQVPEGSIQTSNRPSKDIANHAWHQIAEEQKDGPTLFRFGKEIARVDGKVEILPNDRLWQEMCDRLDWVRSIGEGKIVRCDPPQSVITYMRNQKTSSIPLPRLSHTTSTPVITQNGDIHANAGYDDKSETYNFAELSLPKIMDAPTESDITIAKELLEDVLCDFPFVHESDKAHAYAMMILPFVRPMINGPTPLHLIDKPRQGTGATLLGEICMLIKTGEQIAAQPPCHREEEWQKTLLSNLVKMPEFIFMDNVKAIYSMSLALALTSGAYTARKLGSTEMIEVPVQCTWIFTGNNVEMGADFPRRIVHIRIDSNIEDPTNRVFKYSDLKTHVENNRGKLVWAILTIARAWVTLGSPPPKKDLPSFTSWSNIVGGIVEFMGIKGFLDTPLARKNRIDPYMELEIEFVRCWAAHLLKDFDIYYCLRSKQLIQMCEMCELEYGQGDRGYYNSMAFTHRCMNKLSDRVFTIHTLAGEPITIKIIRETKGGNGGWALSIFESSQVFFDQLNFVEIWNGSQWDR